jgi:hypothetical protein
MKIIAIGNHNVILEATPQEVNMLAGKVLYDWSSYHERWNKSPAPGTVFNVVEGITQLHHNEKRIEEVQRLKQQLQSIILQLELVEPFMKEPEPAPQPEVEPTGVTA